MTMRQPARVGMTLEEVDTPALLIEMGAFERNLGCMAHALEGSAVHLRPHAKTHKSPMIAHRQMALGAIGICCQTLGEAEAMVQAGIPDVLVTNEVVGKSPLARLAALARQANVAVCADDSVHVETLSEAARAAEAEIPVLVEVNVGTPRCGVEPGAPALELARRIVAAPGLRFAGFQAYHGAAQHLRPHEQRREAIQAAVNKIRECLELLEKEGIPCERVTGAGTGTYPFERDSGVYTELQAGSYVFMDVDYAKNLGEGGAPADEFEHSLFVLSTCISRPVAERAIVDAGLKALSIDSGMPQVVDEPEAIYTRASDEHGIIALGDPSSGPRIGDRIKLIPGHCDPTVNLYNWYVCCRNGRVEALWPITAR